MGENRGSILFSSTYRPPVPLDIFSCPVKATSKDDEVHMTDGESYNYNGHIIPPAALKKILKQPKLWREGNQADVESGRLSGMIFVSERCSLETLHIALLFNDGTPTKVFKFSDVYNTFDGVRMEDSGRIAGDYLIYVTTKDPGERREAWTAIYRTNLNDGITERLTPIMEADLSPSVSFSGKKIAVASFQRNGGWQGEIENLNTSIFVMNVEKPLQRKLVVTDGGWPTWGSDSVIFFHRKVEGFWSVFRADISNGVTLNEYRVTPYGIHAITPAAINDTKVAVAIIRELPDINSSELRKKSQYRHIEIFSSEDERPIEITRNTTPDTDHFNPFIIDGGEVIGFHRCKIELLKGGDDIEREFHKIHSPYSDIGLFRAPGVFPTFSTDGSKFAFVDNDFKTVWVVDKKGFRNVFEAEESNKVFSPVWNVDPDKNQLYVCIGPSFQAEKRVDICSIDIVAGCTTKYRRLTKDFNNVSPSTNPEGTKLVFRSTRDGGNKRHKNLYIMHDAEFGEYGEGEITRLTKGPWTDTHCQWSPNGKWIVFSSTRDKPEYASGTDNNLDPGYFAVFLVKVDDPNVVVRVIGSGHDLVGHVNHPFFSPDGKSIGVTSDLAGVSVDPISLPLFRHSVRPYGDIFTFDIDIDDIYKNEDVKKFNRITHSKFENSTATWTVFTTQRPHEKWNIFLDEVDSPSSP